MDNDHLDVHLFENNFINQMALWEFNRIGMKCLSISETTCLAKHNNKCPSKHHHNNNQQQQQNPKVKLNLDLNIISYYDRLTGLTTRMPKYKDITNVDFTTLTSPVISNYTTATDPKPESRVIETIVEDKQIKEGISESEIIIEEREITEILSDMESDNENKDDELLPRTQTFPDEDKYSDVEEEEENDVAPGLFPKMDISDDKQFMNFQTLPLTPSYLCKD